MEEFEPKKKIKIFTKEFMGKYVYVLVLAVLLLGGVSYGATFFIQNYKIASGSITTAPLNISLTDRTINASNLSVPNDNQEGLSEYTKSLTISNTTAADGKVKLTLTRTSGLNLTDLSYAIVINGAVQEIGDVPANGEIIETAVMGNETINVEVRLWPKITYSGSETTFVGEITPDIKYLGPVASGIESPAGKYVDFNCNAGTCEKWQIVKVEDGRLVLTKQTDYSGATSRTNSNKYDSTLGLHDDDNLITSVSTDGKNVYLAKTVKIDRGSGTGQDPYNLINPVMREPDKKVIATVTYKNGDDTVGTQYVYHGQTNYISRVVNDSGFQGWTDGTNDYQLGDTISFTSDTILTAKTAQLLQSRIMSLCNDSNVAYVQKYNATQNGAAIDTPDGSGTEDVCFYTTTSTNRNSDAEQNSNVIFGDYCWQIVRTTSTGGVKLVYNGPKTIDNKCTSDADTTNYSSNPRPSSIGVVGTTGTQKTTISGSKLYGTSFEIYDDNGTNKFRLKNTNTYNWSDSTYQNIIGKYTCLNTSDTCTTLYYVGHYQSATEASTEKYTIGTNAHYSQIGTSSYNAFYDSPALVGYMYNDVYRVTSKSFSTTSSSVIERSSGSTYYYGDMAVWVTDHYELRINTGTDAEPIYIDAPTSTTTWENIRASAGGKYTCKSSNSTTGTSCTTVYYIVANSTDSYMYSVQLSNNENKDKQVTWTYGTGITKSGNTYTLTGTNTLTFKLADWYTDYADSKYKNIYVCDDFTSTTCTTARFITNTTNYNETHALLNYTYYFANDINYDSNTNTYSYDANGTNVEVYDWYHQYNTLNSNHYMCENYDSVNNTCGANNPIYYINNASNTNMYYAILENVPNIETALVNMLSKDTTENSQMVTVNKYNSAIKGVIDSWYEDNLSSISNYLDQMSVYCNDRTITSLGAWSKIGSTTSNYSLQFKYYSLPSKTNATLSCTNLTDRFSKTNEKALLTYPVGLLSEAERAMMFSGFARTGQYWWLGSPYYFGSGVASGRYVHSSGPSSDYAMTYSIGVRPAIVLKPGVEISDGDGTYEEPYVVNTTS